MDDKIQQRDGREALTRVIASAAWELVSPDAEHYPWQKILDALAPLVGEEPLRAIGSSGTSAGKKPTNGATRDLEIADALLPDAYRRRHGIFFTPPALADLMARLVEVEGGVAADFAAGCGTLLTALIRRQPDFDVLAVERDPLLAVGAAVNIARARGGLDALRPGDRVIAGDGLGELESQVDVVVGNPPYVGEKGNAELFRAVREKHRHLESYFAPRMDLHYLFVHRALDALRDGGQYVYLTSEYWLAADGARRLREELARRGAPRRFVRLGQGQFDAAPGHHSLVLSGRCGHGSAAPESFILDAEPGEGGEQVDLLDPLAAARRVEPGAAMFEETRWAPFVPASRREQGPSVKLGQLVDDRQGIVSGADRCTRRHLSVLGEDAPIGEPVFLYHRDELPENGELFRPLLRRSECVANRVVLEPTDNDYILYLDGEVDGPELERVHHLLGRFRPVLEKRREVKRGVMPWYRLHWPRRAEDFGRSKLVVPRRAKEPAFCLDLSGSCISSDCTYLLAPADATDPTRYLLTLMFLLNDGRTARYLEDFGKRKGDILEFYSSPLRDVPIAAEARQGALVPADPAVSTRVDEALDLLDQPSALHLDV